MTENVIATLTTFFRTKTRPSLRVMMGLRDEVFNQVVSEGSATATNAPRMYRAVCEELKACFREEASRMGDVKQVLELYWWTRCVLSSFFKCMAPVEDRWLSEVNEDDAELPCCEQFAWRCFDAYVLSPKRTQDLWLTTIWRQLPDCDRIDTELRVMQRHLLRFNLRFAILHFTTAAVVAESELDVVEQHCVRRTGVTALWRLYRPRIADMCSGLATLELPNEMYVQIFSIMYPFDLDDEFATRYRTATAVTLCTRAQNAKTQSLTGAEMPKQTQ